MRKLVHVLLAGVMAPALTASPSAFAQQPNEQQQHDRQRAAPPPAPRMQPPAPPHIQAPQPPRVAPPQPPHIQPPPAPNMQPPAPPHMPPAPRMQPPAPPHVQPPAPRVQPPAPRANQSAPPQSAAPAPHAPPNAAPPNAAPHPAPGARQPAAPANAPAPKASGASEPAHNAPAPNVSAPANRAAPTPQPPAVAPNAPHPASDGKATAAPPPPANAAPNAGPAHNPPTGGQTAAPPAAPAPNSSVQRPAAAPGQTAPAPSAAPPVQGQAAPPPAPGAVAPRARSGPKITPAGAAALAAGAGLVGGFMAGRADARTIDAVRADRRAYQGDGAQIYQEPGRTIVEDGDRYFLRHDENERFRRLGGAIRSERRGDQTVTIWTAPDGDQIVTVTDAYGQLLRRYRRHADGREVVIIDNFHTGRPRAFMDDVVDLPPPPMAIAPTVYVVDAATAGEPALYDAFMAPPLAPLPRAYTLDEVRYSPSLRAYTRSVDLNTINFDSGSWAIGPDQTDKLALVARALSAAIKRNPNEVYLIEGHTDAVGSPVDNLSLSDRRAQSVAEILTMRFGVPPENLVTQGYGEQYLKIRTQDANQANRRVVIRRITPFLARN